MTQYAPLSLMFIVLVLSACGSTYGKPPLSAEQLSAFGRSFQDQLAEDAELSDIVVGLSEPVREKYGPVVVLRIDGRGWSNLNRGQKDRVVRKAAAGLVEACRPYQAAHGSVCSIRLVDDLFGGLMGFANAGGTEAGRSSYEVFRPYW